MALNWTDPRVKTLYSNKVLENLNAAHVYAMGYNGNYTGDIVGKGSVVRIFSFPRPEVNDYNVPEGDLNSVEITYQRHQATAQELVIDQAKVVPLATDRLQEMLVNPKTFDAMARDRAWVLSDIEDRDLAITLHNEAGTVDPIEGAAPVPIIGFGGGDDLTAFVLMERLEEELKNNDVPTDQLHLFCPHWFYTMIATDQRFSSFGTDINRRTARGNRVAQLANITIHETTNSLDGAGTGFSTRPDANEQNRVIACWEGAATFAPWNAIPVDFIPAAQNVLSGDDLLRQWRVWGRKVTIARGVITQIIQRGEYEP